MKNGIKPALLSILALLCIFPFYWMVLASLRTAGDIFQFPPQLLPVNISFRNYSEIWNAVPMGRYFFNTIVITVLTVFLNVIASSVTGFALARLHFKGKKVLFLCVLSAMIFPKEIMMIPLFSITVKLGLIDNYWGVVLPFAIDALSIFMLRQAYLAIPKEIEEAAYLDGCKPFALWFKIMQPMVKPTLIVVALFSTMGAWSDFMWPMIVLQDPQYHTIQLGLQGMQGTFINNFRFIAAGAVLSIIPVFVLFVVFQKYFVKGIFAGVGK